MLYIPNECVMDFVARMQIQGHLGSLSSIRAYRQLSCQRILAVTIFSQF